MLKLKDLNNKFILNFQAFSDEEKDAQSGSNSPAPTPEEIIELKKNFVPKEQLDEANNRYNSLVKGILEGNAPELGGETEAKPDISKLKKELYHSEKPLSNLEVVSKTLELRKAIIESGAEDPFLPTFAKDAPTDKDIEAAEKVARVLQEAVDEAQGDEALFMARLNKIIR